MRDPGEGRTKWMGEIKRWGKGIDREVEALIEERRYGDREEQDEGGRAMEGNREDKKIEKGGHCETMKKDVGGRAGECVLAERRKKK